MRLTRTNPSKDWTEKERLALINEHATDAMHRRLTPRVAVGVIETIMMVSCWRLFFYLIFISHT